MRHAQTLVTLLLVVVIIPRAAAAQENDPPPLPMNAQEAKETVTKHLDRIGGLKQQPAIEWIGDRAVQEVFPSTTFFAVRYRQWPVAIAPPQGLASSSVLAVGKGDKITVLKSADDLANFYVAEVQAGTDKATEKNADKYSRAWLTLSQELVQDGFYKFEILKPDITRANNVLTVTGRSMVTQGGNGDIQVTIAFQPDGAINASQKHKIQPPTPSSSTWPTVSCCSWVCPLVPICWSRKPAPPTRCCARPLTACFSASRMPAGKRSAATRSAPRTARRG
jgi:hypothetical protein